MQRRSGSLIQRVHGMLSGRPSAEIASNVKSGAAPLLDRLSQRELEVLGLLAAGMSKLQIAGELVASLDTVKKHVNHIHGKLQATSRAQAVARARELAIL